MPKQDKSQVKQFLVVCSHTCAEGGKKPRLEAGLPASQNPLLLPLPPSPDRSPTPSPGAIRGNLLLPGKCKNRRLLFLHA